MIERIQVAFDWLPADVVNSLFWLCVEIMQWLCALTGISYEALNIWLFVIIQPAMIIVLFVLWMRARKSTHILHRELTSVK